MEEIKSDIPVMHFCEYCWATLKDDGTCPTEGCIHNELMALEDVAEGGNTDNSINDRGFTPLGR